jgi:serine/threonine protein phosphatase PrpC
VAAEESGGARGMREVVAAIADGVSGPGARLAAETVVRGFLDGYLSQPPTLSVERAASRVLESLNRWVYSQSRRDAEAAGMATTFTALVLRGRARTWRTWATRVLPAARRGCGCSRAITATATPT